MWYVEESIMEKVRWACNQIASNDMRNTIPRLKDKTSTGLNNVEHLHRTIS